MTKADRILRVFIACIMLMLANRHDKKMLKKAIVCSILYIAVYIILPLEYWIDDPFSFNASWLVSLIVDAGIIYFCLECSIGQAINCMSYALAMQYMFSNIKSIYLVFDIRGIWIDVAALIIIYGLLYIVYAKRLMQNEMKPFNYFDLLPIVAILMFNISFVDILMAPDKLTRIGSHFLFAIFALYILQTQALDSERYRTGREKDHLEDLFQKQKNQYELMKSTIDMINHKCHDLKHQIHNLQCGDTSDDMKEYIEEVTNAISIYDTDVRTDNKALDTVLMEKGLICSEKKIQWSCIADGSMIDFIKPTDIYSIFGNLLDNAIEASEMLENPDHRIVNVTVKTSSGVVLIIVENMYDQELKYKDDILLTTKDNSEEHGYGVIGVKQIVEKYNGLATIRTDNNIFSVQLVIPFPDSNRDNSGEK